MICFVCGIDDPELILEMDLEDDNMVIITCCGGCLLDAYIKANELWGVPIETD